MEGLWQTVTLPGTLEHLPTAQRMWGHVYQSSRGRGFNKERSAKQAWGAVKNAGYHQDAAGRWRAPRGKTMAKKRRTAKQKAATKKMLAANRKKRGKKTSHKRRGKKRRTKKKAKRKSTTVCLVSPVTLAVLSCHKSRRLALEAVAKKRTKYVPLILTRKELAKLKEDRPKRKRRRKVTKRRGRWNP